MKKATSVAALLIVIIVTLLVVHNLAVKKDTTKLSIDSTILSVQSKSFTIEKTNSATENATEKVTEEITKYYYNENVPLSFELQKTMQQACEKYSVPYALALAVAEGESDFNLEANNGTCYGVMQIHLINYSRLRENGIEPTEYEGNITAGVFLLGELLDKYTDTHKALMVYNCGESGAKRLWNEGYMTSSYSVKIVALSEKWQEIINNN